MILPRLSLFTSLVFTIVVSTSLLSLSRLVSFLSIPSSTFGCSTDCESQGSDSALFLSTMHPKPHGYEIEQIFFNGKCVGYKWKVVEETKDEFIARCEEFGIDSADLKVERPATKWYVRLWKKVKQWLKR